MVAVNSKIDRYPEWHRVELDNGKMAMVHKENGGFVSMTAEGTFGNPWTGKPWTEFRHCRSATRFYLRHGFWPTMKP